ncbi:hypothetical protein ACI1US_00990 [Leucobacter sp. BZR 635]
MQRSSSLSCKPPASWGSILADYMPPGVALTGALIIDAYMLLEDNQRRGRLLISAVKKYLGVDHA